MILKSKSLPFVLAALVAAGMFSCAPKANLKIAAESPRLQAVLKSLGSDFSKATKDGFQIVTDENSFDKNQSDIVISWRTLAPQDPKAVHPISEEKINATKSATAVSFERWAQVSGQWTTLPLLWDSWGLSGRTTDFSRWNTAPQFSWKDRAKAEKNGTKLLVGGGDFETSQLLFWMSDDAFAVPDPKVWIRGDIPFPTPLLKPFFARLAQLETDRALYPGTVHFKRADLENIAKQEKNQVFLERYSWQHAQTSGSQRDFKVLTVPLVKGYALPVSILSAVITSGTPDSAKRAEDFVVWLLEPDQQRKLSNETGLMAINFQVPNLDNLAMESRSAAVNSLATIPIGNDETPWSTMLASILRSPGSWEAIVRDSEKNRQASKSP